MKNIKKECLVLGISIFPFVSLYLQNILPQMINSNRMLFIILNVGCAMVAITYSLRKIINKKESIYLLTKMNIFFGFIYSIILLLIGVTVAVTNL